MFRAWGPSKSSSTRNLQRRRSFFLLSLELHCSIWRTSMASQALLKIPPITMVSSNSFRKFPKRKNYLRQKILKTMKKPNSNALFLDEKSSHEINPVIILPDEEKFSFSLEIQQDKEFMVENFSKDYFFKYGFWLLGAFVFQTICAVWVLGSVEITDEKEKMSNGEDKGRIFDLGFNGKGNKSRIMDEKGPESGEIVYWDEEEMEKKIEEIQVMAREVRKRESLERENNGSERNDNGDDDDEEEEEVDFGKSGIEEKVSDRLMRLGMRLGNVRGSFWVPFTENMHKDGSGKRDEAKKDEEGNVDDLMFKKKYKFRDSLSGKTDKTKGFKNSDYVSAPKEVIKDGGSEVLINGEKDDQRKQSMEASKSLRTAGKKSVESEKRKPGKSVELIEPEPNGVKQDGKGRSETLKSSKLSVLETPSISRNMLNQKGDSTGRGTNNQLSEWWLSLPYVLVVFMHRDLGDEGPRGPFTLRDCSGSGSNSKSSHTVAFEDRGDATNFCYILQSFFEDLEDFSAEIVPLSIKELKAAVDSKIIKVIVVKKGQLKLYAGQPLQDVEMALRSILGQN